MITVRMFKLGQVRLGAVYRDGLLQNDRNADYPSGRSKPNYPMPATLDNADTSLNWLNLALCPLYYEGKQDVPCEVCIDRFLDALE